MKSHAQPLCEAFRLSVHLVSRDATTSNVPGCPKGLGSRVRSVHGANADPRRHLDREDDIVSGSLAIRATDEEVNIAQSVHVVVGDVAPHEGGVESVFQVCKLNSSNWSQPAPEYTCSVVPYPAFKPPDRGIVDRPIDLPA